MSISRMTPEAIAELLEHIATDIKDNKSTELDTVQLRQIADCLERSMFSLVCEQKTIAIARSAWLCLCGEQLELRRFDNADMTHTACGNCGEDWWIDWKTNTLNHGNQDEALAAFRMGGKEKSNEPHI